MSNEVKTCLWHKCNQEFEPKRMTQKFCGTPCQGKYFRMIRKQKTKDGLDDDEVRELKVCTLPNGLEVLNNVFGLEIGAWI